MTLQILLEYIIRQLAVSVNTQPADVLLRDGPGSGGLPRLDVLVDHSEDDPQLPLRHRPSPPRNYYRQLALFNDE